MREGSRVRYGSRIFFARRFLFEDGIGSEEVGGRIRGCRRRSQHADSEFIRNAADDNRVRLDITEQKRAGLRPGKSGVAVPMRAIGPERSSNHLRRIRSQSEADHAIHDSWSVDEFGEDRAKADTSFSAASRRQPSESLIASGCHASRFLRLRSAALSRAVFFSRLTRSRLWTLDFGLWTLERNPRLCSNSLINR